jgi:hypothetical protein
LCCERRVLSQNMTEARPAFVVINHGYRYLGDV